MERLPGSPGCFVCDNDGSNPRSLRLPLAWDPDSREVNIPFRADETWCGYSGLVHGGILASIFDDAMAWATHQAIGGWGVTADFHIRYRKPVLAGKAYTVKGRVESRRGRKVRTTAQILDDEGTVFAEADALFVGKAEAGPRESIEP